MTPYGGSPNFEVGGFKEERFGIHKLSSMYNLLNGM